jgi:hypothetical protein
MNTYYTLNLTQKERDLLLYLAEVGYNEQLATWEYAPEHPKRLSSEALLDTIKNAPLHPNIEDVYMHDAQHSGFFNGEKVLVEATVKEACMSMRLSSQHLPVLINDYSKGAVTVTPHVNTVYHMEA